MTSEAFIKRGADGQHESCVVAARKAYHAPVLAKGPVLSIITADTAPVSGAVASPV